MMLILIMIRWFMSFLSEPKAQVRVQGVGKSWCLFPMISNMAEPIWLKLLGVIKYMVESDLMKEFFNKLKCKKLLLIKLQSIPLSWIGLIWGGLVVEGDQGISENVLAKDFV